MVKMKTLTIGGNTYVLQDGELTSTVNTLQSETIPGLAEENGAQSSAIADLQTQVGLLSGDGEIIDGVNSRLESLEETAGVISLDTTTNTATIIGNQESGTSLAVGEDIVFTQNGQEIAVIDEETFQISKGLIADSLQFGKWIWLPRSESAHLTLKWIG